MDLDDPQIEKKQGEKKIESGGRPIISYDDL